MTTVQEKPLTKSDLAQFTGTEQWYRHGLARNVLYTDGVQYLAEKAGAYWLIDEIALLQLKPKVGRQAFQVWKLKVKNSKAVLSCEDGNGNKVYAKRITFTDFPLPEIELWGEHDGQHRVILLPSEH